MRSEPDHRLHFIVEERQTGPPLACEPRAGMGLDYRTEVLPESRHEEWLKFVAGSPEGSIYALPQY